MDARITIVFDNSGVAPRLRYGWGFAAVVDAGGARILFDAGPDPKALMYNLAVLGIEMSSVDAIFISHDHWDHIGGLTGVLPLAPRIPVHVPVSVSPMLTRRIERLGGVPIPHGPAIEAGEGAPLPEIAPGVLSTGEMEASPPEHSMIIETASGPAVLTGCCHQGVVNLVSRVTERCRRPVRCAAGGFHLFRAGPDEVGAVAMRLRELGVGRLVPTHCTGSRAAAILAREFGGDCLKGGAGTTLEV
jgi:7,8-dihydropterin-6-yl-methyl-4-(beta-D-ribofuranosyl)aminobenzene 5'-phosphate synthase